MAAEAYGGCSERGAVGLRQWPSWWFLHCSAGWRKMPSRQEVIDKLYGEFHSLEHDGSLAVYMMCTFAADRILALMDGDNE